MTNYKEILRLSNLGTNNSQIAASCGRSRFTVIPVLQKAAVQRMDRQTAADLSNKEICNRLLSTEESDQTTKCQITSISSMKWLRAELPSCMYPPPLAIASSPVFFLFVNLTKVEYSKNAKDYLSWFEISFNNGFTKLYRENVLEYRSYLMNVKKMQKV